VCLKKFELVTSDSIHNSVNTIENTQSSSMSGDSNFEKGSTAVALMGKSPPPSDAPLNQNWTHLNMYLKSFFGPITQELRAPLQGITSPHVPDLVALTFAIC
jgi:hypothetical protein